MIDFTNKSVIKLSLDKNPKEKDVLELLAPGEQVVSSYSSMRDYVVFTNKRVISVNVQGLTGKKKDFTSLPYSKVQAFSIETAGHFDLDSELQLVFSSLGTVIFEFTGASNVKEIAQLIARFHIDAQHAVKSDLFDPADESAVQLLAQQHDEVARRLHRRIRSLRQVQAVIGAVKRSEQAPVSLRRAQRPQQFHIGYILDLADLARQVFLQFAADLMQQQSVQSHFDHTPL